MYKKAICATAVFAVLFCSCTMSFAHTGRTDLNGGHYNRSTGEYHYHHGYPAHQHTNGACPYDFDDKTGQNSVDSVTYNKEERRQVKDNAIEIDNAFLYSITTNFTSFIASSIAIFMARFAKPKEWTWVWLGIGAFASGAILYNDYTQGINTGSFVFAAATEIVISIVSIFLILKMYKLRIKKGWDAEKHEVSTSTAPQPKRNETAISSISEQDYQRAMRIISMNIHSKEIKELARAMGKTPRETMEHFEGIVRNYNLARYNRKG